MSATLDIPPLEDIVFWSDGSWCYIKEIKQFENNMSGDYSIIKANTKEYQLLLETSTRL